MDNSHCPAIRRRRRAARLRHRAKQHSGYIGREMSVSYAFRLISCQQRLGTRPSGLGEIQAVTTPYFADVQHGEATAGKDNFASAPTDWVHWLIRINLHCDMILAEA